MGILGPILGAVVTVALVNTIVSHSETAGVLGELLRTFANSIRAALGNAPINPPAAPAAKPKPATKPVKH